MHAWREPSRWTELSRRHHRLAGGSWVVGCRESLLQPMNIAGSHSQLDMEVGLQILHFIIVGMISAKLGARPKACHGTRITWVSRTLQSNCFQILGVGSTVVNQKPMR